MERAPTWRPDLPRVAAATPPFLDGRGEHWLLAHCERSSCNPGRRRSDVISYPAIASKGRVDDESARIRTYFD
jgi:hypothetical protein